VPKWDDLKKYDKEINKVIEHPFLIEIIITPLGEPLKVKLL